MLETDESSYYIIALKHVYKKNPTGHHCQTLSKDENRINLLITSLALNYRQNCFQGLEIKMQRMIRIRLKNTSKRESS